MARRFSDVFKHGDDITPQDALDHCANYLGGPWKQITVDQFKLSVIQGGLVNRIFCCERLAGDDVELESDAIRSAGGKSPSKALLRLYGGKLIEGDHIFRNGGEAEEVLVFYTMSKLGLGPRLYGVFSGGRVEEFLDAHQMGNDECLNPDFESAFARALAKMHVLDLPLTRRALGIIGKIEMMMPEYITVVRDEIAATEAREDQLDKKARVVAFDVEEEYNWLKSILPKIKSRKVLVHGDMNRANCLIRHDRETPDEQLTLIDYEFASYGFRGQDIGMHFYNRQMDVSKIAEKFQSGLDYPDHEGRRQFVIAYLDQIKQLVDYEIDESENGLDNVDNVLMESEYFVMLTLIFFTLMMLKDRNKYAEMGFEQFMNVFDTMADIADRYNDRKAEFLANYHKKL